MGTVATASKSAGDTGQQLQGYSIGEVLMTGQTEALFHTYAQFASKTDIEPKPSEDERRTEEQLHEILEKVRTSWTL